MTNILDFGENNRTIILNTSSGTTVRIKPTSWKNIDDLLDLLDILLVEYFNKEGALGSIFRKRNNNTWENIEKILKMCPLIGGGHLTMKDLEELDIDDLRSIFITQTEATDDAGHSVPENRRLDPSMIAVINGLDFFEILRKIATREEEKPLTEQG